MILGKRVRLRAVEREDLPRFQGWLNNEEVTAGLMISLPLSLVDEENWFENMLKTPAEEHSLAIEVFRDDAWMHVGSCGFHAIDTRVRSAEVGIFVGDKRCWNQGYGTEVMRTLIRHGFETLNLNRIFLRVYETNTRAIRSYEKAGFIHEGRMRQAMYQRGQYLDVILMSVLRQDWETAAKEIEE
ncbi:MAG TPA: GNAT family protein [Anaerolineaceae bacterium]